MEVALGVRPRRARVKIGALRTLEWWGAGIALFLQSGAVFALLLAGPEGELTDDARSKLRLLSLPVYLIALGLAARQPRQMLVAVLRNIPFALLVALPFISVLWSIAPSASLRRAIGLGLSMLLAYALAVRFTPRQLMLLVAFVLGASLFFSLLVAGAKPSLGFMPGESTMRGIYIHKNVLGWMSCLAVLAACALHADGTRRVRFIARVLAVLGVMCLLGSQSSTSLLATFGGISVMIFLRLLAHTRGLGRTLLVLLFIQLAAAFVLFLGLALQPLLDVLGKDATLTGRVPLWHLVDAEIAARPILGYGYQAFWTEGNSKAWQIWEKIRWAAPHAHSGYRDMLLALGFAGFAVFAAVIVRGLRQGARLHCRRPGEGWIWFSMILGAGLILNMAESDFLAQNDLIWILMSTGLIAISLRSHSTD